MRTTACFIALLLAQLANSQQVIRQVKNSPNGSREVFYVLASDKSILHGRYARIERYARVEGYYKNGKQDGVWTEYNTTRGKYIHVQGPFKNGMRNGMWTMYRSRKKLKAQGYYKDDQRTGFWRFYNEKGELEGEGNYVEGKRSGKWSFYNEKAELEQVYDYTAKEIVFDPSLDALLPQKFRVVNGNDSIFTALQRPPLFIGGCSKMKQEKTLQIPMKKDSLKVQVRFFIDTLGRVYHMRVVDTVGYPYDREAIYTVQQLPGSWLPAKLNGTLVNVEYTFTVSFKKVILKKSPANFYRKYLPATSFSDPLQRAIQQNRTPFYVPPPISFIACKVEIL